MALTNYELSYDGKMLEGIVGIRTPGDDGPVDVIIPDGVTDIGDRAFDGCTGLTSVTIPDSVTRIGGGGVPRMYRPDRHHRPRSVDGPLSQHG